MSQLRVLVVGASIAGPAAAYWFARAGASVTVIERFPNLRRGGQGIDIRTAGVTVMRKMPGMESAVRAKSTSVDGLAYVRDDGRPYGVLRSTGNPEQQSLISEYEIFRGDLSNIMYEMTKSDKSIRYVFGEQIATIRQDEKLDNPVTVDFANGTPSQDFDLVVACDGATSRTRALGFQCGVRDHLKSTNCWAAYFSIKEDILEGGKIGLAHSTVGGRFVAVGPDPSGVTRATLFKLNSPGVDDATGSLREAMKQGDAATKAFVAQQFAGTGWKTESILSGMMSSEDFYASEVVQLRPPSLYSGRVVLVGDAGYAPGFTGTATSLALAGAYVLAGEVGIKNRGDIAAGLRGYEEVMRPIVKEMSKVPPLVPTFMAPQTRLGIMLRNVIFVLVTKFAGVFASISPYFAAAFSNASEYKLPEYEWLE